MTTVTEKAAAGTLTFHQALMQAEAQARSTLTPELHERLSAAVALVTDGHVFQTSAGEWQVDSTSRAGLTYTVNGVCSCDDHHFNTPPKGLCKHRLAMFLSQRVLTLMQPPPAPVVEPEPATRGVCSRYTPPAPLAPSAAAAPAPLGEAPCSVNCHVMIGGRQVQVTLRGHDEGEVLTRLEAVLARYPMPQPAPQALSQGQGQLTPQQHNAKAMHRPVSGFCVVHNAEMKLNQKDGRSWYSHRTDDGWCKGGAR